jgi:hypothetical protein
MKRAPGLPDAHDFCAAAEREVEEPVLSLAEFRGMDGRVVIPTGASERRAARDLLFLY